MQPMRIQNATRVLAKDQDEYMQLSIRDDSIDGQNFMTSIWEPTPQELEHLVNGGSVKLIIMGTIHPPVALSTQAAPDVNEI